MKHILTKKHSIKHRRLTKLQNLRLHHKILFTSIGVVGVVSIWRGIWDIIITTPLLESPHVSLIVGLILVTISGAFFKLL